MARGNRRHQRIRALRKRDGDRCVHCGRKMGFVRYELVTASILPVQPHEATLDHIVPRSAGGTNRLTNLVLACKRCNEQRGNMPSMDFVPVLPEGPYAS